MKLRPRDLLLAIIRSHRAADLTDRLREFADWESLLQLSRRLRVAPRVYLRLSESGLLNELPSKYQHALSLAYHQNKGRNVAYSSLLIRLIERLAAEGIELALLKGVAHIHDSYSDPAERVLGDIDLLVRQEKIENAVSLLLKDGFHSERQWEEKHPGHHHVAPLRDDSGLVFEIHHNLAPDLAPVAIANKALWNQVRRCEAIPGAYLLHPIDSLIHTSIHLMISSAIAGQIYQLIDIDRLISSHFKTSEAFCALRQRAEEFRCTVPLTQALLLAQRVMGTRIQLDISAGFGKESALLHLAESTVAGPAVDISPWRYEVYRDLLDYRKQLLIMPSGYQRVMFILTRPIALMKDAIRARIRSSAPLDH
jgi:hypothetical protein